jgi:hypothetical protein
MNLMMNSCRETAGHGEDVRVVCAVCAVCAVCSSSHASHASHASRASPTGPFNSWGWQPYIPDVRDGVNPSITPAVTEIDRNFVMVNYNSQEAVDNDDASEYFHTHHNWLVYGGNGMKCISLRRRS